MAAMMGYPYTEMDFQQNFHNSLIPQDTLGDVLANGPALKTFEYLTKDSYYNKGLYNTSSSHNSHVETNDTYSDNFKAILEEITGPGNFLTPDKFYVHQNNGNSHQVDHNKDGATSCSHSNQENIQEQSLDSSVDELGAVDYELLDLGDLNNSDVTEVRQCSLMDIIEAELEDFSNPGNILNGSLITSSNPEPQPPDCSSDYSNNTNANMINSGEAQEVPIRLTKAKSSMVRTDAHAIYLRCQVCSGRASGYHYGAETCGACKIFFARYNQKSPPHTCVEATTGNVMRYNSALAGPCPGCRLQKCFQIGMDIKASKKGRYSYKRKYEYIKRTKQEKTQNVIPASPGNVVDDVILMASHISDLFLSCKTYKPDFFQRIKEFESQYLNGRFCLSETNSTPGSADFGSVVQYGPDFSRCKIHTQRFNSLEKRIRTYIKFARKITGFNDLPNEDQISIFQGNAVFLAKITEYRAYNVHEGLETLPEGHVVDKDDLVEFFSEEYVDLLFSIADKFQRLHLNEDERNLLKCVALFSSEFCTTEQGKKIAEKHQDKMIKAFEHLIRKNRENNPLENCASVIGNAMMVLGNICVFKHKADQSFRHINQMYPAVMSELLMEVVCGVLKESGI